MAPAAIGLPVQTVAAGLEIGLSHPTAVATLLAPHQIRPQIAEQLIHLEIHLDYGLMIFQLLRAVFHGTLEILSLFKLHSVLTTVPGESIFALQVVRYSISI
jgi:hypothetical protein